MIILIRSCNKRDFDMRLVDNRARGGRILSKGAVNDPDNGVTIHWARIELRGAASDE